MKKFIMPAVIMVMATGAAFAANKADSAKAVEIGYRLGDVGEEACMITPKSCDTTGDQVCTWNGHNLRQLDDTSCGEFLYEIQP